MQRPMRPQHRRPFQVLSGALITALLCGPLLAAEPKRGGTLDVGLAQDPLVIDPIRTGSFTERQFATPVYESLFRIDEQGATVPFLAQSHTSSDDLATWRIELREGIRFHDGTALDAEAVVANLERTRDPANRCRCLNQAQEIASVKAVDPHTVEIVLKDGNAALPTMLADAIGVMVSPTAFKASPETIGTHPVGTGPFKFVEWVRGSRFVAERNPDYWQQGKPYLDRIVLRGIQNVVTNEATFQSGQTDMIFQPSHRFSALMKKNPKAVVLQPAGMGTDGIYMNTKAPPFDDVRVRRAVAYAMDRELLRKTLSFDIPTLAYSPFGAGLPVAQPTEVYPEFDLAKAKALVAEYGKPVRFEFQVNNTPNNLQFAQSLQNMWKAAGIEARIQPLDQNRLVQNMTSKTFVASYFRWTGRADPHLNAYTFLHSKYADEVPNSNYVGYGNPKVDELLDRGRQEADPAKRREIYAEMARVLAQDVPIAYLFNVSDAIVTSPTVHGIDVVPDGLVYFDSVWKE
ncbi:ABC transporter substrate-binding protein [Verticiella sediminum]|nr:ABC transporter substrate-binding protein [Verticiella sediminum]